MKPIFLALFTALILSTSSFAVDIKFESNLTWAEIKAKAKRENKMIFFDAYTSWCGPCKFLETNVYTDDKVAAYYNDNFINVKFDMEKGEGIALAKELDIVSFPTLLFFSPSGELLHKNVGALRSQEFVSLGKDALNPATQYFTLKQKVIDKSATDSEFLQWTKLAADMHDNNRGTVASGWLSSKANILATAELAKATLLHADVNEEQLAYLYAHKDEIKQLLGWDDEKLAKILYKKLYTLAVQNSQANTRSASGFQSTIKRFDPSKLFYALQDLAIADALNVKADEAAAMDVLVASLQEKAGLSFEEVNALLLTYIPRFEEASVLKLQTALDSRLTKSISATDSCWIYLMKVVCASRLGDAVAAKTFATKASAGGCLPKEYQQFLNESFGEK